MDDLFRAYPELEARIEILCRGVPWCLCGASALVYDDERLYFEIIRPGRWQRRADGIPVAGIGGIGGSLEPGEGLLACLHREVAEELGARVQLVSAPAVHLLYEQRLADSLPLDSATAPAALPPRGAPPPHPVPVLCTIGANLYRRRQLPHCDILVIVTFLARLLSPPSLEDLFGLLAVPRDAAEAVFGPEEVGLAEVLALPGVELQTHEPLPGETRLAPIWTGRSVQLLMRAGVLP